MENLLEVILLGIIEGITEFLPISSTGHLLIAEAWLGHRSALFNVAIQVGAILAVVLIYRQRLWDLATNLRERERFDYVAKLFVAFLVTIAGGLAMKWRNIELPETVGPVAWALVAGGFAILWIERHLAGRPPATTVTWSIAAWVGAAQVLAAVFPGTSRSAATIFAAMLAGLTSRAAAAEFAFLLGIPTMFAAAALETFSIFREPGAAAREPWLDLAVGFAVSTVVAFVVVKWLLRYIQTHRFTPFAWYRIVLGAVLLAMVYGQSAGVTAAD